MRHPAAIIAAVVVLSTLTACAGPGAPGPAVTILPAPVSSAPVSSAPVSRVPVLPDPTPSPHPVPVVAPVPPATGQKALEATGWFGVALGTYAATVFAASTAAEWEGVIEKICADPNDPKNFWVPSSAAMPGGDADASIFLAVWAAAANYRCPAKVDGVKIASDQDSRRLLALAWALQALSADVMSFYWDRFGPPPDPVWIPTGVSETPYPVTCVDGWLSNSGGSQGACSWHGGVAGG